jgi:hypothetical protein
MVAFRPKHKAYTNTDVILMWIRDFNPVLNIVMVGSGQAT